MLCRVSLSCQYSSAWVSVFLTLSPYFRISFLWSFVRKYVVSRVVEFLLARIVEMDHTLQNSLHLSWNWLLTISKYVGFCMRCSVWCWIVWLLTAKHSVVLCSWRAISSLAECSWPIFGQIDQGASVGLGSRYFFTNLGVKWFQLRRFSLVNLQNFGHALGGTWGQDVVFSAVNVFDMNLEGRFFHRKLIYH